MKNTPQLLESKITIVFNVHVNGNDHRVSSDCDLSYEDLGNAIHTAKEAFLASVDDARFDGLENSTPLNLCISVWFLEEVTLIDSTISIGGTELVHASAELVAKCDSLIATLIPRFTDAMLKNEIGFCDR